MSLVQRETLFDVVCPKGDTLCCRLCKLDNSEKLTDQTDTRKVTQLNLLRQESVKCVLPLRDRSCRSNLLYHPVTVC